MRLIDADTVIMYLPFTQLYLDEYLKNVPTVEAIPKFLLDQAIDYVEDYVCNHEKDTVKAQGMCDALTMIEQYIKENKDGKTI